MSTSTPVSDEHIPKRTGAPTSAREARRVLSRVGRTAISLGLLVTSLVMLFPFVWMLVSCFKSEAVLESTDPGFLPTHPIVSNFSRLFDRFPFATYTLNSIGVAIVTVVVILFTSSLTAYILSQQIFPAAKYVFLLIFSSIAIPFEVKVIPLYTLMVDLHLQDTYASLVLPFAIDAFGVYLFREFILNIPVEYLDAARIDGASEFRIYWRIVLPMCKPIIGTLGIFSFVYAWDQLLWPTVDIATDAHRTLPLGIALLSSEQGAQFALSIAAGVIATVPPLIAFLVFQRRVESGAILAGVKG